MPAETKSAPQHVRATSLEGSTFTPKNDAERFEAINQAFDYRGDVTLTLAKGETLEAFLFNRNPKAQPPTIQIFIKGEDKPRVLPYSEVISIAFTGKDNADGKSWEAWVSKKESERKAEAARLDAEMIAQGHL